MRSDMGRIMGREIDSSDVRAVILAGGKGTRLRPLTAVFPKPLVPLGDKAILEILLMRLQSFGFKRITLCTGYLASMIRILCGDGSAFGLDIEYSGEDEPLGTVGPLGYVKNLTDPFIVMNGDLLTTLNFSKMIDFHVSRNADVTIGAYRRDVSIDFGVIESNNDGDFTGFREKPTYHFEVSMGVNILSRSAMKYVEAGKYMDMPDLILKIYENGGKVCCFREECFWLDIGRMDDYALAQKEYEKNQGKFLGETR